MHNTNILLEGKMYINGKWVNSLNGKQIEITNPATRDIIGKVSYGDNTEAKMAIKAASNALPSWSNLTARERGQILEKIHNLMLERTVELANILTLEQGKPISEAIGEIKQAADFVKWYAEEGKRIYGTLIPASSIDKKIQTWYEPIGVTAAITPWNFPVSMVTRKVAPALAAGCTVVLKPAGYTPFSAIEIFKVFEDAGLPPGVANLVIGNAEKIGNEFLNNKTVRKISFTGSTEIGKKLYAAAGKQIKRLSLELGGHAPFIVFNDADLDLAVEGAILSKFRNAGQTCVCANRFYVHNDILEEFSKRIVERVKEFKIGNGLNHETQLGPVIDQYALDKIHLQVKDALDKGAELLHGGSNALVQDSEGYFYQPTVLIKLSEEMLINNEETFGPVLGIWGFDTEEEVIQKANQSDYGLAAYFYTKDLSRAYRIAESLEYGIVGLNDPAPAVAQAPFGGYKESGIGREGGFHGIKEFLETKFLSIQL